MGCLRCFCKCVCLLMWRLHSLKPFLQFAYILFRSPPNGYAFFVFRPFSHKKHVPHPPNRCRTHFNGSTFDQFYSCAIKLVLIPLSTALYSLLWDLYIHLFSCYCTCPLPPSSILVVVPWPAILSPSG